jgi:cyclophilin family peptidyl-prolyl cis-trans isomerase
MRSITRMFASAGALIAILLAGPAMAQKGPEKPKALTHVEAPTVVTPRLPPASPTDPQNLLYLDLSTGGRVVIWLRPDVAPLMVDRIKTLTRQHFYDGLAFHRVIDGFMAQGGDPKGDGTGGSSMPDVKAEFNYLPHVRGAVAAARSDKEDSANSQFFIVFQPRLSLDRKYTVFGRVLGGMQYVDAIERGEPPANPSHILHAYIAADAPPPYVAAPFTPPTALGPPVKLPGTATISKTPIKPQLAPAAKPK